MSKPIITFLTDFGLRDGYVASMKGVALSICPEAILIDISHEIPAQAIRSGAFVLASACTSFPRGAIHVAVVDPGVGTSRNAIIVRAADQLFIGPDNGLFSWVLRAAPEYEARSLANPAYRMQRVSPTFHGRDIFAPAAAHLARGAAFEDFGPPCTPLIEGWTTPASGIRHIQGEVIHIDRFGNAITNITSKDLDRLSTNGDPLIVWTAEHRIGPIERTYGDQPPGTVLALIGSLDHLEVAVTMGSCAHRLGLKIGDPVDIRC